MKSVILICLMSFLMACTWVKPTLKSHTVVLITAGDAANCVKKGITSVKTLSKMLFIPRNHEKIMNELVVLAKNEAVIMKGDAIVANGKVNKGALDFIVYRCR